MPILPLTDENFELEALQACYARRLEGRLPLPVQLHYGGETTQEGAEQDRSFVI